MLLNRTIAEIENVASEPDSLIPRDFAESHASPEIGFAPLRRVRSSAGLFYEVVPVSGAMFSDPWDFVARDPAAVKKAGLRWDSADAVGVEIAGQRFVLDPSSRRLVRFVRLVRAFAR